MPTIVSARRLGQIDPGRRNPLKLDLQSVGLGLLSGNTKELTELAQLLNPSPILSRLQGRRFPFPKWTEGTVATSPGCPPPSSYHPAATPMFAELGNVAYPVRPVCRPRRAFSTNAATTAAPTRSGTSWPAPGIVKSRAPGIAAAIRAPSLQGTKGSISP